MANKVVKLKIKKGDQVHVRAGRDRGQKGKVIKVFPVNNRVIVEGINMRKKHVKSKKEGQKGETVLVPSTMHISNVSLVCPSCSKHTRVGFKVESGKKMRVCKKCGVALK